MNIRTAAIGMLILVASLLYPMVSQEAKAADLTWTVDQVITGAQSYTGDTITLTGNLTIADGGSLTFSGVTLKMNSNASSRYHIEVQDRGTFNVLSGSRIQANSATYRYTFRVNSAGTLKMDGSTLNDCGLTTSANLYENGLYIASSTSSVTNSTLTGNAVGIVVDGAGCSAFIYKNYIARNDLDGVAVLNGACPVISYNNITENSECGVYSLQAGNPTVDHNDITHNVRASRRAMGGGVLINQASGNITNNTIYWNRDTTNNANSLGVFIYGVGNPTVTYNNISEHRDNDVWSWGILQAAPSATNFPTTVIKNNRIFSNTNGFFLRAGVSRVENNVIDSNSVPNNPNAGGYGWVDGTNSVCVNNTVSNNRYGVMLWDHSLSTFSATTITGNTEAGIGGDTQTIAFGATFINSTLSGNGKDIQFTRALGLGGQGGMCVLLNTSYDTSSVQIWDDNAILIVRWYLHVKVVQQSTDAAVEGARVKCLDRQGGPQMFVYSGSDGWTEWMVLQEKTQGNKTEQNTSLSPYNITVDKGGLYNWTVLKLDQSYEFTLPLDDLPPMMEVVFPQDNDTVNRTTVNVTGRAEPGIWVSVNGVPAVLNQDGNWWVKVSLPNEGPNTLKASAVDRGRNYVNRTISVVRDTTPPVLSKLSPGDGFLVNRTTIAVTGTTDDTGGRTFVNGQEVLVAPDGTFSAQVSLVEGPNTIRVECADAVWNTAVVTLTGEVDTVPPALTISSPNDGFSTNASSVTVRGNTDPGSSVTVGDVTAILTGSNFSRVAPLLEGENLISVSSSDPAGNANIIVLRVVRDSTPPKLNITSPANGAVRNETLIQVRGTTEAGTLVKVNGAGVSFDGKNFVADVRLLQEGENLIYIDAYDALKNHAQVVLKVILDTVAPDLKITSPGTDNFFTKENTIELKGRTEPLATATIDGEPVTVDANGAFKSKIALEQDGAVTFEIIVTDLAGNTQVEYRTVIRDTVVEYTIYSPVNNQKTTWKNLTVSGKVESGASVTIQGNKATVRSDGTFTAEIFLNDGPNIVLIMLSDRVGNVVSKELTVTLTPPGEAGAGGVLEGNLMLMIGAIIVAAIVAALAVAVIRKKRAPPPPLEQIVSSDTTPAQILQSDTARTQILQAEPVPPDQRYEPPR